MFVGWRPEKKQGYSFMNVKRTINIQFVSAVLKMDVKDFGTEWELRLWLLPPNFRHQHILC